MVAQAAQFVKEVAGRFVAIGRVFGQAALDDPAQRRRDFALDGRRLLGQDGGHGLDRLRLVEGAPAAGHFIEDEAEGELVGTVIGGLAAGLLRAHVADGAEDHAGLGLLDRDGGVGVRARRGERRRLLGESEIQNLDPAFGRHHDVGRLQVAVGDAGGVGGGHAFGDLDGEIEEFLDRQRPALHQGVEGFAGHKFADHVEGAFDLSQVVDADDVRVVEGSGGAGLLFEAGAAGGIVGEGRRQDFQGDFAAEARVAGAVDFAHAAGPERGDNFVRSEAGPGCGRHEVESTRCGELTKWS